MKNNIAQLRSAKGITQAELARQLGFSRSYMNRLERLNKKPSVETSVRIATILDCSLDDLFFNHDGDL